MKKEGTRSIANLRFLAFDIDGTLVNTEKKISLRTKSVLKRVQQSGIRLILASGRSFEGLNPYAEELEMRRYGGFILGINGAQIYDCGKQELVKEQFMDLLLCHEYIRAWMALPNLSASGITVFAYAKKRLHVLDEEGYKVKMASELNQLPVYFNEQFPESIQESILKVVVAGPANAIAKELPAMKQRFEGRLFLAGSSADYLEAVPVLVNKGEGIRAICRYTGCEMDQVIAFGDGDNDVPMIRDAGIGVAMGNAVDALKQVADVVTDTNDEDGIVTFLETQGIV